MGPGANSVLSTFTSSRRSIKPERFANAPLQIQIADTPEPLETCVNTGFAACPYQVTIPGKAGGWLLVQPELANKSKRAKVPLLRVQVGSAVWRARQELRAPEG